MCNFLLKSQLLPIAGNACFERVPERLDFVQVRRVRRQRQQGAANSGQNLTQSVFAVERGIIQNHHLAGLQLVNQMLFKPSFNQGAVTVALEHQRRQHLALAPRRRYRDALSAMAQSFTQAAMTFFTPPISVTQGIFDTGFVQINAFANRNCSQRAQELLSRGLIALAVEETLFLRVQPMRRKAREKNFRLRCWPLWSCHEAAICAKVQPSCSRAKARNISISVISGGLPRR